MAQPRWLCGSSPGRQSALQVAVLAVSLLLLLELQPGAAQTNYTVNQAYDLAYAFWSKADIIYIYDSIQITLDNFPTSSVTVVSLALQKRKATATAHAVCLPAQCEQATPPRRQQQMLCTCKILCRPCWLHDAGPMLCAPLTCV